MARNTSITLGDHFEGFVEAQVESGRYQSASEVLRAGLRLLEAQEVELDRIRAALEKGEDSGDAEPIDREAFIEQLHQRRAGRE